MLVQCENWCVMPSWKGDSGLPHYFKSEACNASVMFPGHKKRKKKDVMSTSFTLLISLRNIPRFISYWPMTAFTRMRWITMRSPRQYAHTHCFFLLPQTQTSLGLLRDVHIHFANTQSQWKTDVLCLNTVKQSRGRAKSQIHLQQIVDVFTHT